MGALPASPHNAAHCPATTMHGDHCSRCRAWETMPALPRHALPCPAMLPNAAHCRALHHIALQRCIAAHCITLPCNDALPRIASHCPTLPCNDPHVHHCRIVLQWMAMRAPTRGAPTIVAEHWTAVGAMPAMPRIAPQCPATTMPGDHCSRYTAMGGIACHAPHCLHCPAIKKSIRACGAI